MGKRDGVRDRKRRMNWAAAIAVVRPESEMDEANWMAVLLLQLF